MSKSKTQATADTLLEGFDSWVEQEMDAWKIPGAAIAVVYKGEVVLSKGYGYRDVEKQLPVTEETLFAIGSCSKAFVTFDIALLAHEGKLNWDTPVRQYLPTFKLYDATATELATPRDITSHRTGLPRHDLVWYGSPYSRDELFDRLQYLEPNTSFRSSYYYQNLMYMTAGLLVGRTDGTSWETFTQKRVFDPLGMKDTNFSVAESEKSTNAALPYETRDAKMVAVPYRNIDNVAPAGSINSNLVDMLKWLKLHMTGKHEGKEILPFDAIKETHAPHTIMPITPETVMYEHTDVGHMAYGLGWASSVYRGKTMIWHTGGIDGFSALVSFMPNEDIGVILLTNLGGNSGMSPIYYQLYDRLLGLEPLPWSERVKQFIEKAKGTGEKAKQEVIDSAKPNTSPSHPLADYAGTYEHPAYGTMTVSYNGESLEMSGKTLNFKLTHHHYDVFRLEGKDDDGDEMFLLVQFGGDLNGDVQRFSAGFEPTVAPIVFERVKATAE